MKNMKIIQLNQITNIIKSNSTLAIGGFTLNRKPISLINQVANSDIKNLDIYVLGGSLDIDLLLKSSKVKKISSAYVGHEGLGNSKLFRKNVESGKVKCEDLTEILYYFRLKAGAQGVESLETEAIINSDIFKINSACEKSENGLCKIKALHPDVCIIHAQKADKEGNILIDEPDFCEKEMAQASKIRIFSVEKIGKIWEDKITISKDFVNYVVVSKKGAWPTGCKGYYQMDIKEILRRVEEND